MSPIPLLFESVQPSAPPLLLEYAPCATTCDACQDEVDASWLSPSYPSTESTSRPRQILPFEGPSCAPTCHSNETLSLLSHQARSCTESQGRENVRPYFIREVPVSRNIKRSRSRKIIRMFRLIKCGKMSTGTTCIVACAIVLMVVIL